MRILAVCGSLQAASSNLALLHCAIASAPDGVDLELFDGLRDLPLCGTSSRVARPEPA